MLHPMIVYNFTFADCDEAVSAHGTHVPIITRSFLNSILWA